MLFEDTYLILKKLPNFKIEVEKENFNVIQIFTEAELIKAFSNGDLKFECTGKNLSKTSGGINTSYALGDLEDSSFKEEAIFRYEVIKPLLESSDQNVISRVDEVNSWSVNLEKAKKVLMIVYFTKQLAIQAFTDGLKFTKSQVVTSDHCCHPIIIVEVKEILEYLQKFMNSLTNQLIYILRNSKEFL